MSSMRLEITARHFTLPPALRTLADARLSRALRPLNDGAVSAQVVVTKEQSRFRAEVTLHVRGEHFLHGEATGHDPQAALVAAAARLERQVQRLKGKWTEGRRKAVSRSRAATLAESRTKAAPSARGGRGNARIVRARRYAVKPMSVDEAALELGAGAESFLVFRNAGTDTVNVVFRRPDGRIGLIEPEG